LTGTNLDTLSASSFSNLFHDADFYFAARFRGMSGAGSDKVPAGGADPGGEGHISSTTPEPASFIPWAVFGLGLLVYTVRKECQTQPAVQSA
jgi:hypothetical protein